MRALYRTKDGRADYGFSFEQTTDGNWRAYIVSQPSYGGRDENGHATHRLSDGSRKFVCWNQPVWSLDGIKEVASMWADATQNYIKTGRRF